MNVVVFRMLAYIVALSSTRCGFAGATTKSRQDKKPHIAARTVGWFDSAFSDVLHIALLSRDVHSLILSCDFNENRTSRNQP